MTRHRFSLETSESGLRILTVWYRNQNWQQAIDEALQAYGMTGDQRRGIQIVALPEKEEPCQQPH